MAHIIVVGAGLLGMLTARELAKADNQVTILDQGAMAGESTWAGGGIISPLYPWRYHASISALARWGQARYPELCESLRHATGIDPEYTSSGMLIIAENEIQEALEWAERHHMDLEIVSQKRIGELEPALETPPKNALWMPSVGQVRNPRLARALAAELAQRGVTSITHRPVSGLIISRHRVSGIRSEQGNLEADAVVICAGAWTKQLLSPYMSVPEIQPVRGQMLLFKTKPGLISRIVLEKNRYIIPRQDGRVLFGSTVEKVGFKKETTQAAYEELYAIATERFPALKKYVLEKHWAGLRPGSPAGIPYITQHPELTGLYINAGHFRNGVVLGPASARLCADLILKREPVVPPTPYALRAPREE